MKKLFLVFKHEYLRRIKTKGFIFAVISMPAMLILSIFIGILSVRMQSNSLPIGYLDHSGLFTQAEIPEAAVDIAVPAVDVMRITSEQEGRAALEENSIQALFIIPKDFTEQGNIDVLAAEPPGDNAYARMKAFIMHNLIRSAPPAVTERIKRGSEFTVIAFDGSRSANMHDWFVVLFPFMVGVVFIIVINISGGYLMQSVVDEKENRTMEMIVTSVSPEQLMGGKILGNLCVGLSQLAIWLFFAGLGAFAVEMIFGYGYAPVIQPLHIIILLGIILPGFVLVAALMTLVGVSAASLREAQQISLLFTLPMVAPYIFANAVLQNPDHPLSMVMSIFPLTAVITMPLRASIAQVPTWQIVLTVVLTFASAILSLIAAARVFRASMLNYGKRMKLSKVISHLSKKVSHG